MSTTFLHKFFYFRGLTFGKVWDIMGLSVEVIDFINN
jgi:hypothetical protein